MQGLGVRSLRSVPAFSPCQKHQVRGCLPCGSGTEGTQVEGYSVNTCARTRGRMYLVLLITCWLIIRKFSPFSP